MEEMKTWAGNSIVFITSILLFCCAPPTISNVGQGEAVFVGEPQYILFLMEEWGGYHEDYERTFGDIKVAGTIQNIGIGKAKTVQLIVQFYDNEVLIYEGESFICSSLDAGAKYEFHITHKFEYIHEGIAISVKLGV